MVDIADLRLRNVTYQLFVEFGRAPTAHEVAVSIESDDDTVRIGWRRLHELHALVLQHGVAEIRMANPFSAIPTAYRVFASDRWWYANCAWDAFGVCAALGVDGRIETSCADCGETLTTQVVNQMPDDDTLLFHSLVPASRWWDDIVFT